MRNLDPKPPCYAPIISLYNILGSCSIITVSNKALSPEQRYSAGWQGWKFGIGKIETFLRDFEIWTIFSREIRIQYSPWWAPLCLLKVVIYARSTHLMIYRGDKYMSLSSYGKIEPIFFCCLNLCLANFFLGFLSWNLDYISPLLTN